MLGFSPKLPVSDEVRKWVDEGFRRLEKLVGRRRMLEAKVVLPTAEDFPDPYDGTPAEAEMLFCRVCAYMQVKRSSVELEVFPDEPNSYARFFRIGVEMAQNAPLACTCTIRKKTATRKSKAKKSAWWSQ